MRTLVMSDLHLGSRGCHTEQILEVLRCEPFDRLILNGDTIHNLNLRKLSPQHWSVFDRLRELGRSREVILIRGNHDQDVKPKNRNGHLFNGDSNGNGHGFGAEDVLGTLLGLPMAEDYKLEIGSRSYLVLHGDRFDPTLNFTLVSEMAGWCYNVSQSMSKKLAKWLKKQSKKWGGVLEFVRDQSIRLARQEGYAGIVTGHTHFPDDVNVDGIHYVNTGCWTEPPCTYATVDDGQIRLQFVPE
jgi:UDP-2,3-diacylglucosamine pyrophosphatase LpxH